MKILKTFHIYLFFVGNIFAQTVYTVDNRQQSGAQFTDLQTAINTASAGDILYIHPSPVSYGDIDLTKSLTLIGLGHYPNFTNGETAYLGSFNLSGDVGGAVIKGLRFTSIFVVGVGSTDIGSVSIINNHIAGAIVVLNGGGISDDWIVTGNYFSSTGANIAPEITSENWQIRNNFFRGTISEVGNTSIIANNIMLTTFDTHDFFSFCDSPIVNNNIFMGTGNLTEITEVNPTTTIDFVNNITISFTGSTITPLSGTNNLDNINPAFIDVPFEEETDFYNNNYDLTSGSQGKNAGSDGTDIGIFGNNFEFDNHGIPELMPYPVSINIINSVIAPGQTLNVDFSAIQKN